MRIKRSLLLIVLLSIITISSFAQKGERSLGFNLMYATQTEQTGFGFRFQYGATDNLRLAPSFNYFFEGDGPSSAWGLNLDLHYLFPLQNRLTIYPIGGFNFTSFEHNDGFGINIGTGFQYEISPLLMFNGELKYGALFDCVDQTTFAIGIAYKF